MGNEVIRDHLFEYLIEKTSNFGFLCDSKTVLKDMEQHQFVPHFLWIHDKTFDIEQVDTETDSDTSSA